MFHFVVHIILQDHFPFLKFFHDSQKRLVIVLIFCSPSVIFISVQTISPEAALYETCYVTVHKAACRAGVFHHLALLFISVQTISPEAALYETCYVTAHKAACRAGVFHPNGQLIATGSEDASIKVRHFCCRVLLLQ